MITQPDWPRLTWLKRNIRSVNRSSHGAYLKIARLINIGWRNGKTLILKRTSITLWPAKINSSISMLISYVSHQFMTAVRLSSTSRPGKPSRKLFTKMARTSLSMTSPLPGVSSALNHLLSPTQMLEIGRQSKSCSPTTARWSTAVFCMWSSTYYPPFSKSS